MAEYWAGARLQREPEERELTLREERAWWSARRAAALARKADPKHAAYSSSKAAVVCFTRILALELGGHGIRANAIPPGPTETEMLQGVFDEVPGIREALIGRTVLGKLGHPRGQANAAVFLASDLASHITGEHLIVSGGEFMNA